MSINLVMDQLQGVLLAEAQENARRYQYRYMTNKIAYNVPELTADFLKLFRVSDIKDKTQKKQITQYIRQAIKKSVTKNKLTDLGKKAGYTIHTNITQGRKAAFQQFAARQANKRTQGTSHVLVVTGRDGREINLTYIASYTKYSARFEKGMSGDLITKRIINIVIAQVRREYRRKNQTELIKDIDFSRAQQSFYKLHGRQNEEIDTTVALTSVLGALQSKQDAQGNPIIAPKQVIDQINAALFTQFNVRRTRFVDYKDFVDNFVIELEIGYHDGTREGKNRLLEADSPLLSAFLEMVRDQMLQYFSNMNYKASDSPKKVLESKGSKIISDKVLERARDSKGRFIKVTGIKEPSVKNEKRKENKSRKATLIQESKSSKRTGKTTAKSPRQRGAARTQESAIKLRALLDRMLPQVVQSKMQQPRLVYRTGRFAQSVRTENVVIGPRGGIHIDYTYMKYPYQTFEPGFAQGSKFRDPRSIIKESIREIAITLVGEKFMTIRRV